MRTHEQQPSPLPFTFEPRAIEQVRQLAVERTAALAEWLTTEAESAGDPIRGRAAMMVAESVRDGRIRSARHAETMRDVIAQVLREHVEHV